MARIKTPKTIDQFENGTTSSKMGRPVRKWEVLLTGWKLGTLNELEVKLEVILENENTLERLNEGI